MAERLHAPLFGPGFGNDIEFVDEFHYDFDGTRKLCGHYAKGIDAVL
ncbi:MAG TPA: hypothetical protein VE820_11045 [Sphingomicrobium sp.]|nr:hypothetical protein [Sphingomicrobium sp.]